MNKIKYALLLAVAVCGIVRGADSRTESSTHNVAHNVLRAGDHVSFLSDFEPGCFTVVRATAPDPINALQQAVVLRTDDFAALGYTLKHKACLCFDPLQSEPKFVWRSPSNIVKLLGVVGAVVGATYGAWRWAN